MVTLVVLPAERVPGEAENLSLLAAAGVTVTAFDVPAVNGAHRRVADRDRLRAGRLQRGRGLGLPR